MKIQLKDMNRFNKIAQDAHEEMLTLMKNTKFKKKLTRTQSKLGTDKKLTSVSRRKPKKGDNSTTTSLQQYLTPSADYNYYSKELSLLKYLLWAGIIYLAIWLIWRIFS